MDAFQLLGDSGHVAPPDEATVEAAVDLVLTDAFREGDARTDAVAIRRKRRGAPRRRAYLAGAVAILVAAAGISIPLSLSGGGASAAPVLKLASYSFRLPIQYHLTAATTVDCPVDVFWARPGGEAGNFALPGYASGDAAAATASGGCLFMVLAPHYTPTASEPDPEAFVNSGTQHVQVGPYNALIYTGSLIGDSPVETVLYVEIPLSNGQTQDLVVGEHGLSQSQLIALVANGLSVPSGSSTPISGPSPSTGASGTPAGSSGASGS